jgi:hypothetical protein
MSKQNVKYRVQLAINVIVEVPKPTKYTQDLLCKPFLDNLKREEKEFLLGYLGEPAVEEIAFLYQQSINLKQFSNNLDITITEVQKIAEDE